MNVASLDLCKELYELSGWKDTRFDYNTGNGKVTYRQLTNMHIDDYPAYDLGYLLRKLPGDYSWMEGRQLNIRELSIQVHTGVFSARYDKKLIRFADTPEDALCQLAIELFKQGVLTRKEVA